MGSDLHFVPFSNTVISRYKNLKELPSHGRLDPNLYHGKIRVTLTAKSPVMVAGERRIKEGGLNVALFSKDARGKYRIPGSSFRGLIRQNMQILGLGAVRVDWNEDIPPWNVFGNNSPVNGIPSCHSKVKFDYPRSILGFVFRAMDSSKRESQMKTYCYRSRISVGDLTALGRPLELNTRKLRQNLPRQDSPDFITEKTDGSFHLNGFRQYPPRSTLAPEPRNSWQGFRPLDTGTRFSGVIRYRNLHADELGLLLWCLRLEEGCLHTIGMGKACGYGQMALTIDSLVEYDPQMLYSSLTNAGTPVQNTAKRVEELIGAYRAYAAQPNAAGQDPALLPHIRTFMQIRRKY